MFSGITPQRSIFIDDKLLTHGLQFVILVFSSTINNTPEIKIILCQKSEIPHELCEDRREIPINKVLDSLYLNNDLFDLKIRCTKSAQTEKQYILLQQMNYVPCHIYYRSQYFLHIVFNFQNLQQISKRKSIRSPERLFLSLSTFCTPYFQVNITYSTLSFSIWQIWYERWENLVIHIW
jgi:hypothetical protein